MIHCSTDGVTLHHRYICADLCICRKDNIFSALSTIIVHEQKQNLGTDLLPNTKSRCNPPPNILSGTSILCLLYLFILVSVSLHEYHEIMNFKLHEYTLNNII